LRCWLFFGTIGSLAGVANLGSSAVRILLFRSSMLQSLWMAAFGTAAQNTPLALPRIERSGRKSSLETKLVTNW
jgi:hypothetical protein